MPCDFRAFAGPTSSFVGFLCASLWETWRPVVEAWDDKWRHIHRRDRCRCTSPACERHDITLHHLVHRAHGGSDAPENLTSPCAFCHLEGIHRGRLRAEGRDPNITWTFGRDPILVVRGRERIEL